MQWFSDLPISRKLALGFGALATTVLLVGGIGVGVSRAINARMHETFETHAIPALQLKSANVSLLVASRAVRNAILDSDVETIRKRQAEIAQADSAFRADFAAYQTKIVRQAQRDLAARVMKEYDALRPQQDAIVALALAGDDAAARVRLPDIRRTADSIDVALDALSASKVELMHAAMGAAGRSANAGIAAVTTTVLVALLCAIGIGIAISRPITRNLARLGDAAAAAAAGNVDAPIDVVSRDEVGQLADRLRALMAAQRDMAIAARALSRGDLDAAVAPRSDADVLGHAFVELRTTTRALVADVTRFADGARQGDLSARGDAAAYAGAYANLVSTLNGLLDAVEAPMHETSTVMARIAECDLSARMRGAYAGAFAEIAVSVNRAAEALDAAMGDVGDAAAQVASAGHQIAGGSQSLAEGTSRQSASLEEIGSGVEEMSAMTVQTTANLKQARQMSDAARARVEEGRRAMDALSTAIAEIRRSSDDTARIAKSIEEIAFQTNLLALNAAVEAARAGDAGRGFSVVAEEVRALATRSAEAAKNSSTLIDGAIEQSRRGVALQEEVLSRLAAIDQDVSRVTALVGEIAEAGEQQRAGITQINEAVEQVNGVTQGAAANAEESAAAAQELAAQALSLSELVGRFTTSAQTREQMHRPVANAPRGHAGSPSHRPQPRRRPAATLAAW